MRHTGRKRYDIKIFSDRLRQGFLMKRILRSTLERLRRAKHIRAIRRSGLFDAVWYLARNPDVSAQRIDPVKHYVCSGAAEGRDPSPSFGTRFYLSRNPDVAASGANPLLHYILSGRYEGRLPCPSVRPIAELEKENEDLVVQLHGVQEVAQLALRKLEEARLACLESEERAKDSERRLAELAQDVAKERARLEVRLDRLKDWLSNQIQH